MSTFFEDKTGIKFFTLSTQTLIRFKTIILILTIGKRCLKKNNLTLSFGFSKIILESVILFVTSFDYPDVFSKNLMRKGE